LLYWSSPFALGTAVQDHLTAAGVQRVHGPEEPTPADALLVYVTPQELLGEQVDSASFVACYRALLARAPGQRLIADWRLLGLEPEAIAATIREAMATAQALPRPLQRPHFGLSDLADAMRQFSLPTVSP
jgi:hypothetical protein